MFRKLLTVFAGLFLASTAFGRNVTLEKKNTIVIQGVVDDASMADASALLYKLDKTLPKTEPIYVYMNTPGGSIDAGMNFINYAKSLNRELKTVTRESASMGFIIVQSLGERLIMRDGVLMMHRASTMVGGQVPGEINNRTKFSLDYVHSIEQMVAERLGLTEDEYANMVHDEYYRVGYGALKSNVADDVVTVSCGASLKGTKTKTFQVFFFKIEVKLAECPLISTPLEIKLANDQKLNLENKELFNKAVETINDQYFNNFSDEVNIKL